MSTPHVPQAHAHRRTHRLASAPAALTHRVAKGLMVPQCASGRAGMHPLQVRALARLAPHPARKKHDRPRHEVSRQGKVHMKPAPSLGHLPRRNTSTHSCAQRQRPVYLSAPLPGSGCGARALSVPISHQSALTRVYHSTVLLMPSSRSTSGFQPSDISLFELM